MDAIKQLLSSEHGLFGVLLVIGATILVALGKMSADDWRSFSTWIFGIFGGTHALTSTANAMINKSNGNGSHGAEGGK